MATMNKGVSVTAYEELLSGKTRRDMASALGGCTKCGAPPVLIHYADCAVANRAQRLGTHEQAERDREQEFELVLTEDDAWVPA